MSYREFNVRDVHRACSKVLDTEDSRYNMDWKDRLMLLNIKEFTEFDLVESAVIALDYEEFRLLKSFLNVVKREA